MIAGRLFQEELVPEGIALAGYAFLIDKHEVRAHCRQPCCVSRSYVRGNVTQRGGFTVFDKRYWPGDSDLDHLVFALKHEALDLLSMKRILQVLPDADIRDYIQRKPTGIYARKIWFFHEWLNETRMDVVDCPKCQTKPILDSEAYFTSDGDYLKRYRLKNNLLGNRLFCPIIRRTERLEAFIDLDLKKRMTVELGKISKSMLARASSFMVLADSKASFAIEGESVSPKRVERWGRAVVQAAKLPLTKEEIVRLQSLIIHDNRFVDLGLRKDGVFLGERDEDHRPMPEFIGAKPDDLEDLVNALIDAYGQLSDSEIDPVLHAGAIAFGFVYVHPLQDGNGRLHRYLFHHALLDRRFSPMGCVFPISSTMLNHIDEYREVLRAHTGPLMNLIDWEPTDVMNIQVVNDTRDLYSYFDCTEVCEFLYKCIREAIENDLPKELDFLRSHDKAMAGIGNLVEMPDATIRSLILFVKQNDGVLSKHRRNKEFAALTDAEVREVESIISDAFAGS